MIYMYTITLMTMLTPAEITDKASEIGYQKAHHTRIHTSIAGLLAGMYIALG